MQPTKPELCLFRVQDDDRPLYVLAPHFSDAVDLWREVRAIEEGEPFEEVAPPRGVEFLADADDIVTRPAPEPYIPGGGKDAEEAERWRKAHQRLFESLASHRLRAPLRELTIYGKTIDEWIPILIDAEEGAKEVEKLRREKAEFVEALRVKIQRSAADRDAARAVAESMREQNRELALSLAEARKRVEELEAAISRERQEQATQAGRP
jgi:hypothetical protein